MNEPVRLVVDWQRCDASGRCVELLPELVTRDDWGYPMLTPGDVPPHLRRLAVRAKAACPALALSLTPAQAANPSP